LDDDAVEDRADALALRPAPEQDVDRTDGGFRTASAEYRRNRELERPPSELTLSAAASTLLEPRYFTEEELTAPEAEETYHAVMDARIRQEERDKVAHAPALASRIGSQEWQLQMMKILQRYPVNHLITASEVALMGIWNPLTASMVEIRDDNRMPIADARSLAAAHQLDLIQVFKDAPRSPGDAPFVGVIIADAQSFAMDDVADGAYRARTTGSYETLEVGFTGGTDGHAIHFKTRALVIWLAKRHPIKLVLRKYGTPREGFPFFEKLLGHVRDEAKRVGVHYTASQLRSEGKGRDVIACTLTPTTPRTPLTATTHPSEEEFKRAMDEAEYGRQYDMEVTVHNEHMEPRDRERLRSMQRRGVLWAFRGQGMSLDKQRKLKAFQGALPKGDKHLYQARGDVNESQTKTSAASTVDKMLWKRESNLEQARRGATVLGMRHAMPLDEMVDQGETEGHTSVINRQHFHATGPQLELGQLKERLGLKRNRMRFPRRARGFATLGVDEPTGYAPGGEN